MAAAKTIIGKPQPEPLRSTSQVQIDREQAIELVEGIAKGALNAEALNLGACIVDGEGIMTRAKAAVADFESETKEGVEAGVIQIAMLMMSAKSAITDCNPQTDITKLNEMIAEFSSPASFAYHVKKNLMVNGINIFNEIKTAISDYKTGNWSDFGFQCGKAAA